MRPLRSRRWTPSTKVDLTAGTLTATGRGVDELAVRAAITSAGYQTA